MIQRILIYVAILLGLVGVCKGSYADQTTLTDMPSLKVGNAINVIGTNVQGNTTKQNAMNTELYAADLLKANASCFESEAAFNACFPMDWPTGFDVTADYTVTGAWDFTGATVTGISSVNYTAGNDISISGGTISLSWDKDYADLINTPNMSPLTASMVTGVFPGTGDCLGSNGEKVACGSGSFAFDTFPTYSDSPHTSGIAKNDTHVAIYSGDANGWGVAALTFSLSPTPKTLTIQSPTNGVITCADSDLSVAINCGGANTACTATAAPGASITGITATADSGYEWSAFTGDIVGTAYNNGAVTMAADLTGSATFTATQTYQVYEDFEDTVAGWTETGTGTRNYEYTPALAGTKSLLLNNTSINPGVGINHSFTASSLASGYFYYSFSTPTATAVVARIKGSTNSTDAAHIELGTDGTFIARIEGGGTAGTTAAKTPGTAYKMWWEYALLASSVELRLWVTATSVSTRPETPDVVASRANTSPGQAGGIDLASSRSAFGVYDEVIVDE